MTFFGRVNPERANVNLRVVPAEVTFEGESEQPITFRTSIEASQIICQVSPVPDWLSLGGLKNAVVDVVQTQLDVLGYANNCAYTCEIISTVDESGKEHVFGVRVGLRIETDEVSRIFTSSYIVAVPCEAARSALNDLGNSILHPRDTAVYCYRAFESLRRHFWEEEGKENRSKTWPLLRERLNLSESWIERTRLLALLPRHGMAISLTEFQRETLIADLRILIHRFLDYLAEHDGKNLPLDQYPLL